MRNAEPPRGLLNQELQAVEWTQRDTLAVCRAAENGGQRIMKKKMMLALAMVMALALLTTGALAAVKLLFSPRYDALQLADQALLEKYGITDEMHTALLHTITEGQDAVIVTYEVTESSILQENRFGVYTVTVADGRAEATWSMDGVDTTGGLDAPAWGAEQLLMYARDYGTVMLYLAANNMLVEEIAFDEALFWQQAAKWEEDKAAALSMAAITLAEADAIGREAIARRYGLSGQQMNQLVRYTDGDEHAFHDESTYEMVQGRPLVNLFFHLTQDPGQWSEQDGVYVVTVNLLDGAVEDVFYDTGLLGNG